MTGVPATPSGYSAEPEPCCTVSAVPLSSPNAELERLRDTLDQERYRVAIGVAAIRKAVDSRRWLADGRGPYAWDDEQYQAEFGAALDEIDAALNPLRRIAGDWSDCPRDPLRVAANRAAASAIEAGTAATVEQGAVHQSATRKGDAQ